MRWLFAMIGYVSTATLITAAAAVGYLWSNDRLDDEKMFRMVALLHDVNIQRIANETDPATGEVPPEEPSLADVQRKREVIARDYEVKQEALKRGKQVFDHSFNQLKTATDRFNQLAEELEERLRQEGQLASKQSVSKVVQNLELLRPMQAKEEIRKILKEPDGVDDVIVLMNSMTTTKLKRILQQFQTPEELEELHMIHQVMLDGGPQQEVFSRALMELDKLESSKP